jgi:predicted Zn-dependent peptidase
VQQLSQHTFPNGLTLLAERMDHVRSASLVFMLPAGYVNEPSDRLGLAGVFAEMLTRGAGDRDSKELALALDNLGADRNESAGAFNVTLSAGTLARNLSKVLPLYADLIRKPWLPDDELEPAQELSLQDLQGLEDSPSDLCLLDLKRRYYPEPYSRNQYGTPDGIKAITIADVKRFHAERFRPGGAILSVAGNIDFAALKDQVGTLFGDWTGTASPVQVRDGHTPTSGHITKETNQTQIGVAYPTAAFGSPDFYLARGAIGVLSGGMSARLFTEVREKRGLCYSVSASYDQVKDRASVVCYAGTRSEKAQQTLDVTIGELRRLKDGIADEEIDRVKAGLKTSLIMQQESTSARAGSMASDWFYLNRVRPLDEVQAAVDGLSSAKILAFLDRYPAQDFTVVTLGPQPLTVPA